MGEIVFWTIIRTAVTLPGLWILRSQVDSQIWYLISLAAIYVLIVHPAIQSCRHFDPSAILCMKYDKHPTENYIPCDGVDWEPNH